MIHKAYAIVLLGLLVGISGCKKDKCNAGRTGNLMLTTKMLHHSRPINGCRVFVKYDATEFPGEDTTKYDYKVTADYNSPYCVISNLSCGDYFIYAVGIDSLLDPSNWVVKGGIPYSTSDSEGSVSLNVYITEGD